MLMAMRAARVEGVWSRTGPAASQRASGAQCHARIARTCLAAETARGLVHSLRAMQSWERVESCGAVLLYSASAAGRRFCWPATTSLSSQAERKACIGSWAAPQPTCNPLERAVPSHPYPCDLTLRHIICAAE